MPEQWHKPKWHVKATADVQAALDAASELSYFLEHEQISFEHPEGSLVSTDDMHRLDGLSEALAVALARLEA